MTGPANARNYIFCSSIDYTYEVFDTYEQAYDFAIDYITNGTNDFIKDGIVQQQELNEWASGIGIYHKMEKLSPMPENKFKISLTVDEKDPSALITEIEILKNALHAYMTLFLALRPMVTDFEESHMAKHRDLIKGLK